MGSYEEIRSRDVGELRTYPPPLQRAAYSDRTCWLMALMAELAYLRFETHPFKRVRELAEEMARANGVEAIVERLQELEHYFRTPPAGEEAELLKSILEAAGFELVGTFFNHSLNPLKNTEGFVARRTAGDGRDFSVLSIRGTTSPADWRHNANAGMESIGGGRTVHKGFHRAYRDAEEQITALLAKAGDLPVFVCGHSLGGAVAVMATWYHRRDRLSACYTFGAPRVGNHAFHDGFKTPVYRIVNAFDPVPWLPPNDTVIRAVGWLAACLLKCIPGGRLTGLTGWLQNLRGYRHAGYLHYLTAGEMDEAGRYPTVRHYTDFSGFDGLRHFWEMLTSGQLKRLDIYHNMSTYRRKLRSRALDRAPRPPADDPGDPAATA